MARINHSRARINPSGAGCGQDVCLAVLFGIVRQKQRERKKIFVSFDVFKCSCGAQQGALGYFNLTWSRYNVAAGMYSCSVIIPYCVGTFVEEEGGQTYTVKC